MSECGNAVKHLKNETNELVCKKRLVDGYLTKYYENEQILYIKTTFIYLSLQRIYQLEMIQKLDNI